MPWTISSSSTKLWSDSRFCTIQHSSQKYHLACVNTFFKNRSCRLFEHLIWLHSTFQLAKSVCYVISIMENVSTLLSVQSSTLEGYIMLTIIHLARLENLQKKKNPTTDNQPSSNSWSLRTAGWEINFLMSQLSNYTDCNSRLKKTF